MNEVLSKDLLALIPAEVAHRHQIVPLSASGGTLEVATDGTLDRSVLQELTFLTGRKVLPVKQSSTDISELLTRYYPGPAGEAGDGALHPSRSPHGAAQHQPPAWGMTSVVQQVDQIIERAIEAHASDIHVEPYETFLRVRYRLDGVLHTVAELSLQQKDEITARLKIMASLDIAEKRRPQDGRLRVTREAGTVDIRVSTLPTDFGEKVVLRILDKSGLRLDLEALGFAGRDLALFRRTICLPYGMILVTGPTGSGKTTTLYAALHAVNTPDVNITTIEDPIEYNLPDINQTHVRSDIGFTFAQALRAFLRQDPNIIMVGEIRNAETAEIAIRAALTGHLVLSTLHTNDAPSTITRLVDMGIEPFLVASSMRLVLAQRLVRRICPDCRREALPEPGLLADLQLQGSPRLLYRGAGCERCNGTGYRGRTALFEVMPVSETIAEMIAARAGTQHLRRQARNEGMRTLREAALEKLYAGMTTAEEVLRETTL